MTRDAIYRLHSAQRRTKDQEVREMICHLRRAVRNWLDPAPLGDDERRWLGDFIIAQHQRVRARGVEI